MNKAISCACEFQKKNCNFIAYVSHTLTKGCEKGLSYSIRKVVIRL